MTSWQLIESAPKDGTPILGWDGVDMATVKWHKWSDRAVGGWDLIVCGAYAEYSDYYPTHWVPIPEPPHD
jgi:hypothetical protein